MRASAKVLRSTLHPDSIAEIGRDFWAAGCEASGVLLHSSRTCVYRVDGNDRSIIVKVFARDTPLGRLELVARLIHRAGTLLQSLPKILRTPDGAYTVPLQAPEGERLAMAYEFVPGTSESLCVSSAARLGNALAELHQTLDQASGEVDLPTYDGQSFHLLGERLVQHSRSAGDARLVKRLVERLQESIEEHRSRAGGWGVVHGDFAHNYLSVGDQPVFIDFEHVGLGSRPIEIAHMYWTIAVPHTLASHPAAEDPDAIWAAFVNEYQKTRPLSVQIVPLLAMYWLLRDVGSAYDHVQFFGGALLPARFFEERIELIADWSDHHGLRLH